MKELVIKLSDCEYEEIKEDAEKFRSKGMVVPYLYKVIESGILLPKDQLKTGEWIEKEENSAVCSCCNKNNILYGDFCKWCGARNF